jgi:hypothetical protein
MNETVVFGHLQPNLAENTSDELLPRDYKIVSTKPLISERDPEPQRWRKIETAHITSRIKVSLAKSG